MHLATALLVTLSSEVKVSNTVAHVCCRKYNLGYGCAGKFT